MINGEVTVPKSTPITATDLGNNTFKITWAGQNQRGRVLIYLSSLFAYTPYFSGSYAVETEDDGTYILQPSVFEKIKLARFQITPHGAFEPISVRLMRKNAKRKTTIKQPSTGTEYTVFGGLPNYTQIDVSISEY